MKNTIVLLGAVTVGVIAVKLISKMILPIKTTEEKPDTYWQNEANRSRIKPANQKE